jgi:hypothetical protein
MLACPNEPGDKREINGRSMSALSPKVEISQACMACPRGPQDAYSITVGKQLHLKPSALATF